MDIEQENMIQENMVMNMDHDDMIHMDREIMTQKQEVLMDVAEKQVMIKKVLVEAIGAMIETTIMARILKD